MANACSVRVRGVVQGVGFRPFVYRIARENSLAGWVLNAGDGVEIHVEGSEGSVDLFLRELFADAPAASSITAIDVAPAEHTGAQDFSIRASPSVASPTTRISPDLPVCPRCLAELADPGDPRFGYPYINCTDCGPRYSIIEKLPYDRANTTMAAWPMDERCAEEYADATSRRFHAQPIACPTCGPHYLLETGGEVVRGDARAIERAAALLRDGEIVAIKGLGGYHLACDARRGSAVQALRERKFRKEKPFALMVRSLEVARELADLSPNAELLLTSQARPIVLARARVTLPGVAPDNGELGLMLPYTPLHHMLFSAGAPEALVMTSANRSSEPIAYEDDDAREHLTGIADAFLVGERPIARRVEDSVARVGLWGPVILRRSRGYAPGAVAALPTSRPLLAVGADLKNAITLVVDGQAFVSQHIGDLESWDALRAWQETIRDLLSMYQVRADELLVVHDAHPEYRSTAHANELGARAHLAVQHHRAHIASVLAEHALLEERVVGVSFDGTGYGDDATIWGGEVFVGSVAGGFERVAHLRQADLVGGDAAARHPVQAAAGFLRQLHVLPALTSPPFDFPRRFGQALRLHESRTRTFRTTSVGRLFDTAAALLGFTRPITFEGQAAIWLEQLARESGPVAAYPFPFVDGEGERQGEGELDFRPLLVHVIEDRRRGRPVSEIARGFHSAIAAAVRDVAQHLCESRDARWVVLSGGVFQNALLLEEIAALFEHASVRVLTNHAVPPNDGGISLGQAALAAFAPAD